MNFVIFSYNFLPQNDAEAFCTARFANALAESGHSVKVVTMDWPQQVSEDIVSELIPALRDVCRVSLKPFKKPYWSRLKYLTNEWFSANIDAAVKEVKKVLREMPDAVLISRGNPATSNIVGYCCRKYAKKWIVHFSDPFPWFSSRLNEFLGRRWGRKMISAADYCSITCDEVKRFFAETYGDIYNKNAYKFIVNTHIGDPMIGGSGSFALQKDVYVVSHCGSLSEDRGVSSIVRELPKIRTDKPIRFVQCGGIPESEKPKMADWLEFRGVRSPREITDLFEVSDINLVADLRTRLPYIPFLPSKFVYLLFTDNPIVAYTMTGSCMDTLARRFPTAGIYVADFQESGSLTCACEQALKNNGEIDRTAIRKLFMRTAVVNHFIQSIS